MALIPFKRPREQKDAPLITIRDGRFHYNSYFARVAELNGKRAVAYSVDDERREIAFEFFAESSPDIYTLENRGGLAKFRSNANSLIAKKAWVRCISRLTSTNLRAFQAKKDGRLWLIRLMPAFDHSIKRDRLLEIPLTACGIYRYRADDGEVVYIGKGKVRSRATLPDRSEWRYGYIDYSLIDDESEQYKWEEFWLRQFKDENEDRLPYYNRQAGNVADAAS